MTSVPVACTELYTYLKRHGYRCDEDETIKLNDLRTVCCRILKIQGETPSARIGTRAKKYVEEQLGIAVNGVHCPMSVLRQVVNHVCDLDITSAHMHEVRKELAVASRVKKREPRDPKSRGGSTKAMKARKIEAADDALVCKQGKNVLNTEDRFKQFENHSAHDLKWMILRREDELQLQKGLVRQMYLRVYKEQTKSERLAAFLLNSKARHEDLLRLVQFRAGAGKWCSEWGGYSVAMKRAKGLASARTTLAMVAGDDHQGKLQNEHIVSRYESRLSAAKVLQAKHDYDEAEVLLEFVQGEFDATQQEAVGREKMHVSLWTTSRVSINSIESATDEHGALDIDHLATSTRTTRVSGDLQVVYSGTGAECYNNVKQEMRSVGLPNWQEKAEKAAVAPPGSVTGYFFGTDGGPDCVGMAGRVRMVFAFFPVMFWIWRFCLFHRAQRICVSMLIVLDNYDFSFSPRLPAHLDGRWVLPVLPLGAHALAETPPSSYVNGVSCIGNTWRSTGSPTKIRNTASRIFAPLIAKQVFAKTPGRVLRNRWLSIDSVELLIKGAIPYICSVFMSIWGHYVHAPAAPAAPADGGAPAAPAAAPARAAPRRRRRRRDPGQEEHEEYQRKQSSSRRLACLLVRCKLFLAMVVISYAAKQPLVFFFLWLQKASKEHNDRCKRATERGTTYLGATPLSLLALQKKRDFRSKMTEVFDGEHDNTVFGQAFSLAPPDAHNDCRRLAASLCYVQLASWDFRFESEFEAVPLSILQFLEAPNNAEDMTIRENRKAWATKFLSMSDDEFVKQCQWTDMPQKCRGWYRDEWEEVASTGTVPAKLFAFLSIYRARMPYQNQGIEGVISILQRFAKAGNRCKRACISDRLRNKIDDSISLRDAVTLNDEVRTFLDSEEAAMRWVPLVQRVPREVFPNVPLSDIEMLAKRFENTVRNRVMIEDSGLEFVYATQEIDVDKPCFLICWSYGLRYCIAKGTVFTVADRYCFRPGAEYPTGLLKDQLAEMIAVHVAAFAEMPAELSLFRSPLTWTCIKNPEIDPADQAEFRMKPSKAQRNAKPKAKAKSEVVGPGHDVYQLDSGGSEDPDAEDLGPDEDDFHPAEDDGEDVLGDGADDAGPEDLDDDGELREEGHEEDAEAPPALPVEELPLDLASVAQQEAAATWVESRVEAGFQQACQMKEKMRVCQALPVRAFDDISLVRREDGKLLFVYWTAVTSEPKVAYEVELDARTHHLKTIVPARNTAKPYPGVYILIPRTGVTNVRGKYKERETPIMPAWVLNCRFFEEVQGFGGPWPEGDASLPSDDRLCWDTLCLVCVAAAAQGVDQKSTISETDLYVCCHCLQSFHEECSLRTICIRQKADEQYGVPAESMYPSAHSFCCPFCANNPSGARRTWSHCC